jgi:cell division protease FtsH
VVTLLAAERSRLDALAEALLERETLDQIDAYRIAGLTEPEAVSID